MKVSSSVKYVLTIIPLLIVCFVSILGFRGVTGASDKDEYYQTTPGFILGVNGHPLSGNRPTYLNIPVQDQIQMVKGLGFSYYRVDGICDPNGKITREQRFLDLAAAAKQNNIKLLITLSAQRFANFKDADSAYKDGFRLASGFVKLYGQYADHYELGNEIDNKVISNRKSLGKDPSDYDQDKFRVAASYLKGMYDGVKSISTASQTIIDIGETHTGFMTLLKQNNIPFDIIGFHYYSKKVYEQEDNFRSTLSDLTGIFNGQKPIWITEFNQFLGSANWGVFTFKREDSQKAIINNFITNCSKKSNVKALFIYELLDEPDLDVKPGQEFERNFGIIKMNGKATNSAVDKPIAQSLRVLRKQN